MRVKLSEQPPPAPTTSAEGPCPTVIQIVGRPSTGSLPSTIAPPDHPPDNVKMLGLQKVIYIIICKAFCHQSFYEFCFVIVSLYCYQISAGKVIQRSPYFHSHLYLPTITTGVRQSSVRRFLVCMLLKLLFAYC